jgi:hypothetical protein
MTNDDDVNKKPAAPKNLASAAEIAGPAAAGPAPRIDASLLRFLIELAVNPDFRAKFNAAPRAAINDISPDMSDEEKQAIIDRDSVGIRDMIGAGPLQHGLPPGDLAPRERSGTESSSARSGQPGRRRVVRVEVEFED